MSDDSSSDEDWGHLAAAAVSIDDVTSGFLKVADKGKSNLERKRRKPDQLAAAAADPGARLIPPSTSDADDALDAISLKVRSALDARLDRWYKKAWSKHGKQPKPDPENLRASPVATPSPKDARAGSKKSKHKDTATPLPQNPSHSAVEAEEDDSWIPFFRKVKPGTPCVLKLEEAAEQEPTAKSRKHQKLLKHRQLTAGGEDQARKRAAQVAVDGQDIQAAAVKFGAAVAHVHGTLPLRGTVVDSKVEVPHDVRICNLLGLPPPQLLTC